MTLPVEWTDDDKLQALRETRSQLEAIEREWKHLRQQSRRLSMELICDHGYSVAKISALAGHHRNTLKVWLDVHQATHPTRGNS